MAGAVAVAVAVADAGAVVGLLVVYSGQFAIHIATLITAANWARPFAPTYVASCSR